MLFDSFARTYIFRLIQASNHDAHIRPLWQTTVATNPLFDPDELYYASPVPDPESAYAGVPMRQVVARIVDGSSIVEFKRTYGTSILAGFARIEGHPVGVVANTHPMLCAKGSRKAAHFVTLCSQRRVPVVFLQDVMGFDMAAGESATLKEASLLMRAVACASVPKLVATVGRAIGPASYALCGRAMAPTFSFMWPTAKIMIDNELPHLAVPPAKLEEQSTALYAAARMWVDDIISPPDSRSVLAHCLSLAQLSAFEAPSLSHGVFRF